MLESILVPKTRTFRKGGYGWDTMDTVAAPFPT